MSAEDVMQFVHDRMDAITSESPDEGFEVSGYRLPLANEPDSAIDGLYYVDVDSFTPEARTWGDEVTYWNTAVTIRVGYYRGGGDLGDSDRQHVTRNAGDDVMRIVNVVCNPVGFNTSTTGIRTVRHTGSSRVVDRPHAEIWEIRLQVQWAQDLITT